MIKQGDNEGWLKSRYEIFEENMTLADVYEALDSLEEYCLIADITPFGPMSVILTYIEQNKNKESYDNN